MLHELKAAHNNKLAKARFKRLIENFCFILCLFLSLKLLLLNPCLRKFAERYTQIKNH